jgi:hypothetical protein
MQTLALHGPFCVRRCGMLLVSESGVAAQAHPKVPVKDGNEKENQRTHASS